MPQSEISGDVAITSPIEEQNVLASTLEDAAAERREQQRLPCASPFSFFENLPAELRDHILLHIPDLSTLRSLIWASPTMHAQYMSNRNALLRSCLARELDGCFIDAYACVKSRVREIGRARTDKKITDFLAGYRTWLSGPSPPPDVNSLQPGLCRWLAAFHLSVIRPLGLHYAKWALENLKRASVASLGGQEVAEAEAETAPDRQPTLSRSEEIRIFRALYRYEIFCHLFGCNKGGRRGDFSDVEINEIFIGLFDPWEAEAIGCIDLFLRDKYKDIFEQVKWDFCEENPKYWHPSGARNSLPDFDLDGSFDGYLEGTIARGLRKLAGLLVVKDHQTLVDKIEKEDCITHGQVLLDATLRAALWNASQIVRREEATSVNARDEAERRRDPMKFEGDVVPPDGPPLAWVLLWSGIYANIFGEHTPASIKDWGYVMWDERRWTELGAKDLVVRQWETEPDLADVIEGHWGWRPVGC
ncbi:hypothetical protein B0I37DRAFT_362267 [Chaetomium sp. MPI-CAGE-AT-0009]|nr:hypothetical protein B0I37DRAFT_362267 [Chaetomium sp. MPI-CAGE-AT-0009]